MKTFSDFNIFLDKSQLLFLPFNDYYYFLLIFCFHFNEAKYASSTLSLSPTHTHTAMHTHSMFSVFPFHTNFLLSICDFISCPYNCTFPVLSVSFSIQFFPKGYKHYMTGICGADLIIVFSFILNYFSAEKKKKNPTEIIALVISLHSHNPSCWIMATIKRMKWNKQNSFYYFIMGVSSGFLFNWNYWTWWSNLTIPSIRSLIVFQISIDSKSLLISLCFCLCCQ